MIAHDPVIRSYCKQTGKTLELPGKQKRRLLKGLGRELEERFSEEDGLTLEMLFNEAGSPEESASALMECVGKEEQKQYLSRKKLLARVVIAVLVLLVISAIAYVFYAEDHQIDHTKITVTQYIEVPQLG